MKILHMCPAGIATGGTEGIHHLVSELNKCGADAEILYIGLNLDNPQPKVYDKYRCPYITELPKDFDGVVIFPEIWGNKVIETKYSKALPVINWQGIDVYKWQMPESEWYKFLRNKRCMHLTMSEYGMDFLRSLKLNPIKISDCISDAYLSDYTDTHRRKDTVLYNPSSVKMTSFQETVMARCTTEYGIRFQMLEGYTQSELINIFRQSKLYIDFGVFSGRERLPREAVSQGCCILTSTSGTAGYYEDNSIPNEYKLDNIDKAMQMIKYVIYNYELCKPDFDEYRKLLKEDLQNYHNEVKEFYNAILNNYTRT